VSEKLRLVKDLHALPLSRAALVFAEQRHHGQRRKVDGAPFIAHPKEVAELLRESGAPDHVIAAGALHDVLEDTDVTREELARRFGREAASLVAAVTEDPAIPERARRKAALRGQVAESSRDAALVFAADKISKAREQQLLARRPDGKPSRRKVRHYERSLAVLEDMIPGHPLVERLAAELRPLRAALERSSAAA
jgi:(p)ppGpp synthase/HD superfamily hydrolase